MRPREQDTPLEVRLLQWEILRQKPLEERLQQVFQMADLGQQMVRDRLRRQHPDWNEGQIRAETFRQIYRDEFSVENLEKIAESFQKHHDC